MFVAIVFAVLVTAIFVPHFAYYMWNKKIVKKEWDLLIDPNYNPKVSLIIATYNEAAVIEKKLEDVQRIIYPKNKLQVILVDSASTDGTLDICKSFIDNNRLRYPIKLLSEKQRLGKSHALNVALEYAEGEIIATSDADAFWEPNALINAVHFFADQSVGAVTGREVLTNIGKNVLTMSEGVYRDFYYTLRLGESKTNSLLIFDGSLGLYRKSILEKFEESPGFSDDIGTAINLVSKGYRCIFVPEALFHDVTAHTLGGRIRLKSRRAQHLIAGVLQALKLKIQSKISISATVVVSNFYMHVVAPLLFVIASIAGLVLIPTYFPASAHNTPVRLCSEPTPLPKWRR